MKDHLPEEQRSSSNKLKMKFNIYLSMQNKFTLVLLCCLTGMAIKTTGDIATAVPVTLRSDSLSVKINPQRAYTIDSIWAGKSQAGTHYGNWGFVFHPGEYKWVGSGHTEGGTEQVDRIDLLVDGKPLVWPADKPAEITGRRIELIKHSRLYDTRLTSRIVIHGDKIQEEATIEFPSDQYIQTGYPFMHCWTTNTTRWLARTDSNKLIEGHFDSSTKWRVKKNLKWLAMYAPTEELLILMEFPPDLPPGKGIRQAVDDRTSFHKHYYQAYSRETLLAGRKDNYRMSTRFIHTPPGKWQQRAQAEAREYEGDIQQASKIPQTSNTNNSISNAIPKPMPDSFQQRFKPIKPGDKPEWLKHPVAMDALNPDIVLKPWFPIKVNDTTVTVWERTYNLGEWGLPLSIKALGKPLLTEPMQLIIETDAGIIPPPRPVLLDRHAGRVRYLAKTEQGTVHTSVRSTIEYDGFMRYDITLENSGSNTLRQLALVIKLEPEQARFIQHASAWTLGMSQQSTARSLATPKENEDAYHYGFTPFMWIGGYNRGLAWTAESDEYWFPAKNDHAITVCRHDNFVELRIDIITAPVLLPQQIHFSFALMATPVKPLPAGWRSWHFSTEDPATRSSEKYNNIGNQVIFWYDKWRIVHHYPVPRDIIEFSKRITALKTSNKVQRIYPYLDVTLMSKGEQAQVPGKDFFFTPPEWRAFGQDWTIEPNFHNRSYIRVSPASSWADFSLACVKRWILEGGANGVYLDESFPYADTRADHGMGYDDPQGIRQPTYAVYATRDFYKRLAWLFQKYADGPPALLAHSSSTPAVPYLSFADIYLSGEQFYHKMRKWPGPEKPNYIKMASDVQFHAELRAVQFGLVPVMFAPIKGQSLKRWPELKNKPDTTIELLTLCLLHDVLFWPVFANPKPAMQVLAAKERFHIGDPDVTFHPYWENPTTPPLLKGGGRISYYHAANRTLAVVANLSDQSRTMHLNVNRLASESQHPLSATDAIHPEKSFTLKNGWITDIEIPPYAFRLIRINFSK